MLVMETLLDTTDSPEAHKLFELLSQDVDNIQLAYYSENSFINAVLSNKVKLCKEKGISAEVNALVPTDLTIDEMDLCRALVNLIDNAIEASERDSSGTEKKVDINIFDKEGYLFIIPMFNTHYFRVSPASSHTPVPKSHARNLGQPIRAQSPTQPTTASFGVPEPAPPLFL